MRYTLKPFKNVLKQIGNPEHQLPPSIHVAGTNGKGSTVAYLVAGLQAIGYKVGAFTSPHIVDFNERITIDGTPISIDIYQTYYKKAALINKKHPPALSEFELMMLTAILFFNDTKNEAEKSKDAAKNETLASIPEIGTLDIIVWETGLGGRLDATNVLTPIASVITSIGYDHQSFLGESLQDIAGEKAGIIKPNVPVFMAPQHPEASQAVTKVAKAKNAELFQSRPVPSIPNSANLKGEYQKINRGLAKLVLEWVGSHRFERVGGSQDMENAIQAISKKKIENGLDNAFIFGRNQSIILKNKKNTQVLIDAAHNEDGFRALAQEIKGLPTDSKKVAVVIGLSKPGDRREGLRQLLDISADFYYCEFDQDLSWAREDVMQAVSFAAKSEPTKIETNSVVEKHGVIGEQCHLTSIALQDVERLFNDEGPLNSYDLVVISGSIYFISNFYKASVRVAD